MHSWNTNTLEITSDYVTIGNKGLKATQSGNGKFIGPQLTDASDYIGKTLKFSVDILTPNVDLKITLMQNNGTTYTSTQSTSISSGSSTHAEVSSTIESDTTMIWIRIEQSGTSWGTGEIFYTDNWCLEEV